MERRQSKTRGLVVLMALITLGAIFYSPAATWMQTIASVQAATATGWIKEGTKQYYYQNGKKATGWKSIEGKWYFFHKKTGVMQKDKVLSWKGEKYYLNTKGVMITGWEKTGSDWYYAKSDGSLYKGWAKYKGKWYYVSPETGKMVKKQFIKLSSGTYYLKKTGVMAVGWAHVKGKWYFANDSGKLTQGWATLNSKKYFLKKTSCDAATGWNVIDGKYYYFDPKSCAMMTGWVKINGSTYYLNSSGQRQTGFITLKDAKYYLDENGIMKTGWVTIGSDRYYFASDGKMAIDTTIDNVYLGEDGKVTTKTPTITQNSVGSKTIKGLLQNAMKPVGACMYIWGGGHNDADAMRIGVNPTWKTWYNKQTSSYDFQDYLYKYGYGLDCSGYVGWSIYNTVYKKSGQNYLTNTSTNFPAKLASKGWGTLNKTTKSSIVFKPGDIVSMTGHIWVVIGQCSDGSVVIAHATPPVVQISGTVAKDGTTNSEAVQLATQYMKKYFSNCYNEYKKSSGRMTVGSLSYMVNVNRFTWNTSGSKLMGDPERYQSKTAKQVLMDLFGG